jgi:hypothetical protein
MPMPASRPSGGKVLVNPEIRWEAPLSRDHRLGAGPPLKPDEAPRRERRAD